MFGIKKSFFGRLKEKIEDVIFMRPEVDEDMLDELEEVLITSDIGMETTLKIVSELRDAVRLERLVEPEQVKMRIAAIVERLVDKGERHLLSGDLPMIILVIGVNGGGKTTSIAKLANLFRLKGNKVLLAAADTFRAAAGEQLEIWAERAGVSIIKHQEGADPSAVIFDAIKSAKAKGVDVVICDTAGRLQTKKNLMAELEKMNKVISREFPEAAKETLLVLDATTGKNAVSQAKEFGAVTDITGIILTKMDGTAKGGIIITISDEFDLPVKFIGVGEKIDDFKVFDPREFALGIFAEEVEGVGEEADVELEPEKGSGVGLVPVESAGVGLVPEKGASVELEPEAGAGVGLEPEAGAGVGLVPVESAGVEPEPEAVAGVELVPEAGVGVDVEPEERADVELAQASETKHEMPELSEEPKKEEELKEEESKKEEKEEKAEKKGFWKLFRRK